MLILSLKQMISKALMLCPIPFPIVSLQAMSYVNLAGVPCLWWSLCRARVADEVSFAASVCSTSGNVSSPSVVEMLHAACRAARFRSSMCCLSRQFSF